MIKMGLTDRAWRAYEIRDIFSISSGKRLKSRNRKPGRRPFIGALDNSNGVVQFVSDENESIDHNVLGVNYNGNGMGIGFYHPYECVFSDDVKRFHLLGTDDCKELALFMKTSIEKQRGKFGYLYKFNASRMAASSIMLPCTDAGEPDYDYMKNFACEMWGGLIVRYKNYVAGRLSQLEHKDIHKLVDKKWEAFRLGDLFTVSRPMPRNKDDYKPGDIPFVASGAVNNGVMKCCYAPTDEQLDKGNCITVSPIDGATFYQPVDFLGRGGAGSSVLMLRNRNLNLFRGMFMARAIQQTCSKYNYGHMGNKDSIKRERVMLPVDDTGEPDYDYMEQYIKNMMLKKYKQYLTFIDKPEHEG